MKHSLLLLALLFAGCNDTTTTETNITHVKQGDNGLYIYNENGTVTYTSTTEYGDEPTGEFDASDDATECRAKGYFYCPLDNKCMPKKLDDGACNG